MNFFVRHKVTTDSVFIKNGEILVLLYFFLVLLVTLINMITLRVLKYINS